MTLHTADGPYIRVHELLESIGGKMVWQSGGAAGGGTWSLTLHGKTARVRVQDNHVNALDELYAAKVASPSTWDDFDSPGELRPGAFWRLVALFSGNAATSAQERLDPSQPSPNLVPTGAVQVHHPSLTPAIARVSYGWQARRRMPTIAPTCPP